MHKPPSPDDLESDEGFGYFRSVWVITEIPTEEAREILSQDRSLSQFVSDLSTTEHEFDDIATAVETGSVENIEGLSTNQLKALAPYLTDEATLEGLEIGVAGLVHCLSAAGIYPAASCRGHPGPRAWSSNPVVFFAADQPHAEMLEPLVGDADCGFSIDPARTELLVVESTSIENTLNLADAILRNVAGFKSLGDPLHGIKPPAQPSTQPSLFDDE